MTRYDRWMGIGLVLVFVGVNYVRQGVPSTSMDLLLLLVFPVAVGFGFLIAMRTLWAGILLFGGLWLVHPQWEALPLHALFFTALFWLALRLRSHASSPVQDRRAPRSDFELVSVIERGHRPIARSTEKSQLQYPILKDLSKRGCYVDTATPWEVGAKVTITLPISLPSGKPTLKLLGVVKWSSTNPLRQGMGIQFIDVGSENRVLLRKLLKSVKASPSAHAI